MAHPWSQPGDYILGGGHLAYGEYAQNQKPMFGAISLIARIEGVGTHRQTWK